MSRSLPAHLYQFSTLLLHELFDVCIADLRIPVSKSALQRRTRFARSVTMHGKQDGHHHAYSPHYANALQHIIVQDIT